DVTHFDGKFFSTLKLLITRPGFLSNEYKMGRRASYLNPIRMYVFTSAIFFLVFFSVYHFDFDLKKKYGGKTYDEIAKMDSLTFRAQMMEINDGKPMTWYQFNQYIDSSKKTSSITWNRGERYYSKEQYDSALASGKVKHSWLKRKVIYRLLELNRRMSDDRNEVLQKVLEKFMHSFPQMFFISLPLFAFFLKLIYRRQKDFYYVSHAIFSVHFYIFVFILSLVVIGLLSLRSHYHLGFIDWITGFLYIWIFVYQYKAMRNFYGQRRGKTIAKFILLNIYFCFLTVLLFAIFFFFFLFKV
ncbi:MAG: DUF3667 domain-containing protein, partial [Chryseobacterium sp.]